MGVGLELFVTHKLWASRLSASDERADGFTDSPAEGNAGWMSFSFLAIPPDKPVSPGNRLVTIRGISFLAQSEPAEGCIEIAVLKAPGDRIYVQNKPPAYDRSVPYFGWTFVESFWAPLGDFGALPAVLAAK